MPACLPTVDVSRCHLAISPICLSMKNILNTCCLCCLSSKKLARGSPDTLESFESLTRQPRPQDYFPLWAGATREGEAEHWPIRSKPFEKKRLLIGWLQVTCIARTERSVWPRLPKCFNLQVVIYIFSVISHFQLFWKDFFFYEKISNILHNVLKQRSDIFFQKKYFWILVIYWN